MFVVDDDIHSRLTVTIKLECRTLRGGSIPVVGYTPEDQIFQLFNIVWIPSLVTWRDTIGNGRGHFRRTNLHGHL